MPPPVGTRSRRVRFVIFFRTSYVGSKSRQHLRGRGRLSPLSDGSHPPSPDHPSPRWSTWGIMAWFMYQPITSIGVSGAQRKDPSFNSHWWCKNWRGRGGKFNNFKYITTVAEHTPCSGSSIQARSCLTFPSPRLSSKRHLHLKWPVVHQQLHVIRNTAYRPSTQASYTASRVRPKRKISCAAAQIAATQIAATLTISFPRWRHMSLTSYWGQQRMSLTSYPGERERERGRERGEKEMGSVEHIINPDNSIN